MINIVTKVLFTIASAIFDVKIGAPCQFVNSSKDLTHHTLIHALIIMIIVEI
jgi:hypothetical protein